MATLELKFSADQQYQIDAVNSICKLFRGQEFMSGEFLAEHGLFDTIGHSNGMRLSAKQLKANLNDVQEENALAPTDVLTDGRLRDFTVEMETGTGKTYVYTRTSSN